MCRFHLFGACVPVREMRRLRKAYDEMLKRKDLMISELHEKNSFLLRTALEQARKKNEVGAHAKRLVEINNELNAEAKLKKHGG